jgi:hypothetical protein
MISKVAAECLRECFGSINNVSEMSPEDFLSVQAMSGGGLDVFGIIPECVWSISSFPGKYSRRLENVLGASVSV